MPGQIDPGRSHAEDGVHYGDFDLGAGQYRTPGAENKERDLSHQSTIVYHGDKNVRVEGLRQRCCRGGIPTYSSIA